MATLITPDENATSRVNNELSLGSDMEFQRKWWRFEKVVWWLLLLVVVAALCGVFGRGFLAHAKTAAKDGSMRVEYDRFARFSTPSMIRVEFGATAAHEGKVQLWASNDLMKTLGAQRVVPQPLESTLASGGVVYTFPVQASPAMVQFTIQPAQPGIHHVSLRVPNAEQVTLETMVWP
jgi:hypothetical protein